MASLVGKVDYNAEPNAPFEIIPAGKYLVQIIASEWKPTSTGGEMLVLELEIMEGEFSRRKLWDRLNLVNNSTQAVEIAQRTMSAIRHATGVLNAQDSEELHFKPMLASVKVRPAVPGKDGKHYDASNVIGGYEPTTQAAPAHPAAPAPQHTRAAPVAAKAGPPWAQRQRAPAAVRNDKVPF